jgi:hypothetical protein
MTAIGDTATVISCQKQLAMFSSDADSNGDGGKFLWKRIDSQLFGRLAFVHNLWNP